jgi:outer membrane protein OmpA-like peptidoglycan-associated protein/Tol biopolymer transport system component
MRKISVTIGVLVLGLLAVSCSTEKKATKAFRNGEYQSAIDLFKKSKPKEPGRANYFVAESYRLSNRLKDAEKYYEKAGGRGVDKDSIQFYYAQSLKANSKYEEARKELEELQNRTANEKLKDRARAEIDGLQYLSNLKQKPSYYKIKNLELLNSPFSEYAPAYLNNELYYTSSRSNGKIYEATGTPFTNLFKVASRGAIVDMATLTQLPSNINTENVNNGCVAFSPDGKIMVFAKGNNGKRKGGEDVDLYLARFRNGVWGEPAIITGSVNSPKFWDSTPAFSPDGRTLYFASNRDGGYGGTDIYAAQMDSRGRFSRIRNMGPEINTPGNEMFPYVAEDAKLYFASDAHPGFGALDIFVVKRANGKTSIENLGEPVNSASDDFGIFLVRPDRGFFTSNREGGKGDDDVYTFVNEDPNLRVINYYLAGITYTPDKAGKLQILPNTKVSVIDANSNIMQDYVTGTDGKFLFRVYENEDYNLIGELDGYLIRRQEYTTKGKSVDPKTLTELVTNITLDTIVILDKIEINKVFVLENIYFEFDSTRIQKSAATELDKLVQLLIDNPEIKIEMGSHTDSIGSNVYNYELSKGRAESTVRYLIQHGISPDRLVAKGYGEEKPVARNTNPDGTDNRTGRDKNRRTEFKILEVNALPKPIEDDEEFDEDKYFKKGDGN